MEEEPEKNKILHTGDLDIKIGSTVAVFASRGSGKSVMIASLIYNLLRKHNYHSIDLFSETAQYETEYEMLDKQNIHSLRSAEGKQKIAEIIDRQKKAKKTRNALIILDDVDMGMKVDVLDQIFTMARHWNLTIICGLQFLRGFFKPLYRTNCDVLMFRNCTQTDMELLYQIIVCEMVKKEFIAFVKQNTTDYKFIVYQTKGDKRLNIIKAHELKNQKKIRYV